MATKTPADAENLATEFVAANSKLNEAGDVRTMALSSYYTFFEDVKLVSKEMLLKVTDGNKDLAAAAINVATDDLLQRGAQAKKNGEDPKELVSTVKITRPDGALEAHAYASKTINNPQTHQQVVKHGAIRLKVATSPLYDDKATLRAEELITKMMS